MNSRWKVLSERYSLTDDAEELSGWKCKRCCHLTNTDTEMYQHLHDYHGMFTSTWAEANSLKQRKWKVLSKVVQDKVQFYGGWVLIALASFGTIYIVTPNSLGELETLDKQIIVPIIMMLILPLALLLLFGCQFIEKGLTVKDGSES